MKSVFKRIEKQNPSLSSLICFNMAVMQYKYPIGTINKHFDELVDKKDYMRRDRDDILEHTYSLGQK